MRLDRVFMNGIYPELFTRRRGGGRCASRLEQDGERRTATASRSCAGRRCARRVSEHRRASAHREQLERLAGGHAAGRRSSCRSCSSPQLDMDAVEELADAIEEQRAVNVGDLLEDKEICICAGSGGVGKTTTSAAIAMGMAARGLEGRRAHDRPGQAPRQLARAARARQRGAARRPRALRRARHRDEGRAVGDDARREAHVRRPGRAPRARRGDARPHPVRTASTRRSPTRWPARRSTWRWRSSTSCTRRRATTCSCSTRRRRATRSTSSTRPSA